MEDTVLSIKTKIYILNLDNNCDKEKIKKRKNSVAKAGGVV